MTRFLAPLTSLLVLSCGEPDALTVNATLHLEEHLESATLVGSAVGADVPRPVEWRFDEEQPSWTWAGLRSDRVPSIERTEDALRIRLTESNRLGDDGPVGACLYTDVPDWTREDWAYVMVRARTSDEIDLPLGLGFNLPEDPAAGGYPFRNRGERVRVIYDGSVQTYLLRADWSGGIWEGPWRQLGLCFGAEEPGALDLLSVSVIPKEAGYAEASAGVREELRSRVYRRSLWVHAPATVEYRVRMPEGARLDVGLGVLREDAPVTFRVTARDGSGEPERLFEETYSGKDEWGQRTLDLSHLAGRTVTLALEADSEREGTVALWASPTVTARASEREASEPERPNVIFYVIDGGAADYMSVYGYNRRTTPNLERLAAEGVLFERAYSNASWTKPATASFMTSLQHSVLGGYRNWSDPVPEEATTMAEHMHRAGYQTAVFLANANAGTLSNLQRGVDWMQEGWAEFSYIGGFENHKQSSRYLHDAYWRWREAYPGTPYWVHFQTTDVHEDFPAVPPFSGLFVSPEGLATWREWDERLSEEGNHGIYSDAWERTGLSRTAFFALHQGLYDETMAHNDYQLGRLVERLKAQEEWENTLLIIGADHSTQAAMDDMGAATADSLPPPWNQPILRPTISRVPLIFVWPGRIAGGQRFEGPVSMIDVLPTLLDLLDLAEPEVAMGQSLAPLLLGEEGWEPRPVILDEFEWDDETGELAGRLEMVDGRWGASLWIGAPPEDSLWRRPVPLLLYDLWNDPFALRSVHEENPDLVRHYTALLEEQWTAHRALAERFSRSGDVALSPDQLELLRSLGYIR